ncbi:2607_t:CDS:2 [Gigaspora rosea]|nr:2607_t:CDS:2 [Gigaspora rosea]
MPPRRKHLGGDKLVKTTGKKFKCPNCSSNFNSHTEVVNHQYELSIIRKTSVVQFDPAQIDVDSRQIKSCRELDRLINELTRAEEKYLPLIEHGYPVKQVFDQSRQSIWQLKENFKTFTQRQFSLNKPILHKRALAEKEKVAEKHKKLPDTHESLLKNHATLKKDYDALLENNSVERCRLLEQENCVLINRNLELFEEIEELRKEIETLKKRNESLSCVIVIDDFNFQSYCSEEKLAAILCEIEVYMGFPELSGSS